MLLFPARITQGETVKRTGIVLSDYPASDWSLRFVFVIDGAQTLVDAAANGTAYDLVLPNTVTAAMTVGDQYWQAWVTDGSERFRVGEGVTRVIADYETRSTGFDARSALRQQVDAMRAIISGTATADQKTIKYAGREIEKYERAELITVYRFLKAELLREERAAAAANGQAGGGRVRVRF